jgi:hypothetical protein
LDVSSLIDRLNESLNKLNNLHDSKFFTNDKNSSWNFDNSENSNIQENSADNISINNENIPSDSKQYNIEINEDILDLTVQKEKHLLSAQNMFKKSIRISLKAFLISITLSFLNLFI